MLAAVSPTILTSVCVCTEENTHRSWGVWLGHGFWLGGGIFGASMKAWKGEGLGAPPPMPWGEALGGG